MFFCIEIDKLFLTIIQKCRGLRIKKTVLKKKKIEDYTFWLENSSHVMVIRMVCYWGKMISAAELRD